MNRKIQMKIYENISDESMFAHETLGNYFGYPILKNSQGVPVFINNDYWSISHKKNIVFLATSNQAIGIDIEIGIPRAIEIFSIFQDKEYDFFGEKTFHSFYFLWTIKESIIKLERKTLDELNQIKIHKVLTKHQVMDNIHFDFEIISIFENKYVSTMTGCHKNIYYSVSTFL